MTEEDWKWFELWKDARRLSEAQIGSLEEQLIKDQSNMDVRVQLFFHYSQLVGKQAKTSEC